jgi:TRAP-type C4-dicarboxylate transport system permease small subunit
MTGRGIFQLLVLLLGVLIFGFLILILKLSTGKSWKSLFAEQERLAKLSFGLAFVALIVVFALFMIINNQ